MKKKNWKGEYVERFVFNYDIFKEDKKMVKGHECDQEKCGKFIREGNSCIKVLNTGDGHGEHHYCSNNCLMNSLAESYGYKLIKKDVD